MTQRGRALAAARLPAAGAAAGAWPAARRSRSRPGCRRLLLWWFKPWLDRTLLHIYARQAFGEETSFAEAWEARRRAPWLPMLQWLTIWRLSFWRAYSMPVSQLEGQTGAARRQRVKAILRSHRGAAMMMQSAFSWIEVFLTLGLVSLVPWMTPGLRNFGRAVQWLFGDAPAAPTACCTRRTRPPCCSSSRSSSRPASRCTSIAASSSRPGMSNRICAMRSPRADRRRTLARAALRGRRRCVRGGGRPGAGCRGAPRPLHRPPAAAAPASAVDPRAARIEAAVDKLRVDPLLSGRHKEHRLRWKDDAPREEEAGRRPTWASWPGSPRWRSFINDTSRFLLWGLAIVLVALALVSARHLVQLRAFRRPRPRRRSSHVRDLDVRPESLPDDVGAAAWALWQAGQVPAALSLLYRGALSRLIHRFAGADHRRRHRRRVPGAGARPARAGRAALRDAGRARLGGQHLRRARAVAGDGRGAVHGLRRSGWTRARRPPRGARS